MPVNPFAKPDQNDDVFFVAIAYYNNTTQRDGTQIFWGFNEDEANSHANNWRNKATSCQVVDEFTGECQFQNLNQQVDYLD